MKILMFLHGGSRNRGCEAIVRSGVALIKNKIPDAKVDLASWKPETDAIIPLIDNVYLDKSREIKKFSLQWLACIIQAKLFNNPNYAYQIIHSDIITKVPNYDILLSIGGDNYCYGEQHGFYEINKSIKKAGKKLVLWGASIGEEDLSDAKIEDLKSFDLILARESLTHEILIKNGLTNVKLCADGAFTMQKEELPLPDGWKVSNTMGFNFSPLVWKKNKNSRDAAIKLVQHIIDTTTMTIAFTPHVIEPENDDYECLEHFYETFKNSNRVLLLPNNLNAIQYKGYIARMRFFIGARTHATIAAYSTLIPTMVLGYSVKSKGIAKDIFGEEKLVLNLNEISDSQKLIEKFDEMVKEEEKIIETLANNIPRIKEMSKKAVQYLQEV
ncbi:polysaccharide pyruvyl transferase family protein [Flavobacterium sp.]|uniref:polysaccharide pyruvyl transferase family protein n=1 Tax=Flavobacterium sp. TaxID=239 RepID=UPI003751E986